MTAPGLFWPDAAGQPAADHPARLRHLFQAWMFALEQIFALAENRQPRIYHRGAWV